MCPKVGHWKETMLEAFLWGITGGLLVLGWFLRLTNNHYQKGYRDGYNRGKAVALERHFD
jgi:hypothetical protein